VNGTILSIKTFSWNGVNNSFAYLLLIFCLSFAYFLL